MPAEAWFIAAHAIHWQFIHVYLLFTCRCHYPASMAQSQQETAIQKVLSSETTNFFKQDFTSSYSFWHVIPQSTLLVSFTNGETLYLTGKELNAVYTAKELKDEHFPDKFERGNWKFIFKGSTAYVTFDQTVFKEKEIAGLTHESRFMEKISGEWKIVATAVLNYKK